MRARKLPAARAPEANRMGTALVMPTNEVKMLMPNTAASLQRALRKPNAVVLREEEAQSHLSCRKAADRYHHRGVLELLKSSCSYKP